MAEVVEGLVSVVIPVFNRPALVRSAVESVLAQTYPHFEVIVVDDGSTDETPEVLEAVRRTHPERIRVLRIGNGGPGLAREAGRQFARGEFVQYLDSDDQLLNDKLAAQVAAFRKDPVAGICNGPTLIDRGSEHSPTILGERLPMDGPRAWFPTLLISRQWQTGTPLYRRSLIDRAGAWEGLRMYEDWIYEAKIASLNPAVCYAAGPLLKVSRAPMERLDNIREENPREHLRHLAVALARVIGYAREAGVRPVVAEYQVFIHHLLEASARCAEIGLGREALDLALLAGRGWVERPALGMFVPVSRTILRGTVAAVSRSFQT